MTEPARLVRAMTLTLVPWWMLLFSYQRFHLKTRKKIQTVEELRARGWLRCS